MKIGFSTLGCPKWSWREIIATAKDLGYDGIELRGVRDEMYMPRAYPFIPENIHETKKMLERKQLEISCVASSCYIYRENPDRYIREGKDYIDIAKKIGSPYIRVLGDGQTYPSKYIDHRRVASALKVLGEYGRERNVGVLIETNGVYANSKTLFKLMHRLDTDNIGILWNIHNPYRMMGEDVGETYSRLKRFIRYVHIKDSIYVDGKVRYRLLGHGDVPIEQAISMLKRDGYNGYLSLEWAKRWYYDLEEPGIAFPHFIDTIKAMIDRA